MDLVREEGMQQKPYLTKMKNINLVSEDDDAYVVDCYINYCCHHHLVEPMMSKAIRYPKYAWKIGS